MIQATADAFALGLGAAGVVVLALSLVRRQYPSEGIALAMELWTAAGLLRLADGPGWNRIATAATIVVVRRLVLVRSQMRVAAGGARGSASY